MLARLRFEATGQTFAKSVMDRPTRSAASTSTSPVGAMVEGQQGERSGL
jgi:hypothetical protein